MWRMKKSLENGPRIELAKKSHAIPLDQISSKPNFEVHQDEGLVTPSKSNHHGDHVLMSHKPKKEEETPVAVALFEPPDPTKRPMYCKHLVYQGVTEFQFEELRAARYRQKIAKEEVAKKKQEVEDLQMAMREEKKAMLDEK